MSSINIESLIGKTLDYKVLKDNLAGKWVVLSDIFFDTTDESDLVILSAKLLYVFSDEEFSHGIGRRMEAIKADSPDAKIKHIV